ncbi:DNA-processing protein DprA [Pseudomonadales bacterium]|nr:DNA-processing protein DprA [Pseudomonadales bacterium]
MTNSALRLCELLVGWPRQVIHSWLFSAVSPLHLLASTQTPPESLRRRTKLEAFLSPLGRGETQMVCILDDEYPALLKMIPDPPLVLFYLGSLSMLAQQTIAIVGARQCTTVGKLVAEKLAADLAEQGICTISGLAYGIDAAAHKGALSKTGGCTAAFLGAGLGNIYPRQNQYLGEKIIAEGGVLLSEYPYEIQPRPYQFPERNRLISGASLATIMVEGGERSGSLITARMALEQGREVFAVPGSPLSEVSKGCHRMIRQGAALATSADEVMEEMGWFVPLEENTAGLATEGGDEPIAGAGAGRGNLALAETGFNRNSKENTHKNDPTLQRQPASQLSAVSQRVLATLSPYGMSLDEISLVSNDDPQEISQSLVELQLAGFVRQGLGGYIRVS